MGANRAPASSTTRLAAVGAVHAVLSLVVVQVCLTLAGAAVMLTDPCGPARADDPICDGTTLGAVWILLTLTALCGPVVGVLALVRAVHRLPWLGWLGAGWAGSVTAFLVVLGVG